METQISNEISNISKIHADIEATIFPLTEAALERLINAGAEAAQVR